MYNFGSVALQLEPNRSSESLAEMGPGGVIVLLQYLLHFVELALYAIDCAEFLTLLFSSYY